MTNHSGRTNWTLIKAALAYENADGVISLLKQTDNPADLVGFREQKILMAVANPLLRRAIANQFLRAVARISQNTNSVSTATQYVNSIEVVWTALSDLSERAKHLFDGAGSTVNCHPALVMRQALSRFYDHIGTRIPSASADHICDPTVPVGQTQSADYARHLHDLSGDINDVTFAGARALNEWMRRNHEKYPTPLPTRVRYSELEIAHNCIHLAAEWNSIEYIADKLSYGFYEAEVMSGAEHPAVHLSISDIALERARMVAIERRVVQIERQQRPSYYLREGLELSLRAVMNYALAYYQGNLPYGRARNLNRESVSQLEARLNRLLGCIDADDDLLVVSARMGYSVQVEYLASICLQWWSIIGHYVQGPGSKNRDAYLWLVGIPTDQIASHISSSPAEKLLAERALMANILTLPTSRHFALIRHPFFRCTMGQTWSLSEFADLSWNAVVRERLVKGDIIGKTYGEVWEDYLAHALSDFGWVVHGKGIRIREGNRVLTDVDIAASKGELLLLIQLKATAIPGFNTFDQWKSRLIIESGARQAALAQKAVTDQPRLLMDWGGRKLANQADIIQPVVLTTCDLYNGWTCHGVPITSIGGLMTLLQGANVTYRRADDTAVESERFGHSTDLTAREFVELLHHPVEWRVSHISASPKRIVQQVGGVTWNIPSLV